MRLTEKVLEHGLNSTAVHGVPAGCGHWICVRKKREKRERKTKRDREKETETENCKRLDFLLSQACLAFEHPAVKGRLPLTESSGPGYRHFPPLPPSCQA